MKVFLTFSLISLLVTLLSACSNKDIYTALQTRNKISCYDLPIAQQRECEQGLTAKPYEEYSKDLEERY